MTICRFYFIFIIDNSVKYLGSDSHMYMQQSVVQCESGLHNKQATFFIQKAKIGRASCRERVSCDV